MKMSVRMGCKNFAVYVKDEKENDNQLKIEDIPILNDVKDIFPEEVPGLPPKRDIEFTADLVLGKVPT